MNLKLLMMLMRRQLREKQQKKSIDCQLLDSVIGHVDILKDNLKYYYNINEENRKQRLLVILEKIDSYDEDNDDVVNLRNRIDDQMID